MAMPQTSRAEMAAVPPAALMRSEEHTSELQSQFHLVCRLLLEKNKQRVLRVLGAIVARASYLAMLKEQLEALYRLIEVCFFFNDTATTEIYTLSLHDALPI